MRTPYTLEAGHLFRLTNALSVLTRGTPGTDGRVVPFLVSPRARLAAAANLAEMRRGLQPIEDALNTRREELATEQKAEDPTAKEFSRERLEVLRAFEREINREEVSLYLILIPHDGVDPAAIVGGEIFDALAELSGFVISLPAMLDFTVGEPRALTP